MAFSASSASAAEVAKVNGRSVTDQDLRNALSGYNEGQQETLLKDINTKKELLEQVVNQELVHEQAQKAGVEKTARFLEAVENFKKQYASNLYLEKKLAPRMTDAAAQAYYKKNKIRYGTDQVRAQHILVESEGQARQVLAMAKKKGADFQDLAEKYSRDPSAKNNRGDIGFFTYERMVEPFSAAAFDAGIGQIVGPVKTQFGYHVVKVVDKKVGRPMEYSEVELRVKADLKRELAQEYLQQLRKSAKIQINEAALKAVK